MIATLILVTALIAAEETRGYGLILLGMLIYSKPGVFAGILIIMGILHLGRK